MHPKLIIQCQREIYSMNPYFYWSKSFDKALKGQNGLGPHVNAPNATRGWKHMIYGVCAKNPILPESFHLLVYLSCLHLDHLSNTLFVGSKPLKIHHSWHTPGLNGQHGHKFSQISDECLQETQKVFFLHEALICCKLDGSARYYARCSHTKLICDPYCQASYNLELWRQMW